MDAAVEIYNRLSVDLLPTPAKSHYVFNLRDLSKCVQGETVKILLPNNSSGVLKGCAVVEMSILLIFEILCKE